MTLRITDLAALDPAAVDQMTALVAQLLAEAYPTVELRRGVAHDYLIRPSSALMAAEEANVDAWQAAASLRAIEADPALAEPELVDAVLSNYGVTRAPGAAAAGLVAVVLDAAAPITVPAGFVFSAGSVDAVTEQAYAVRTSAATTTGPTDLVLTALGNGQYSASIPVVASALGSVGMIRRGTAMAPGGTIPHLVAAYAAGDFTGGVDSETNADLVARLMRGVAAEVAAGRLNIEALTAAQAAFADVRALSIVGYGDPEMSRDRRGVFPVATGGRCDVYARTAPLPADLPSTRRATLIRAVAGGGVWQLDLDRDAAPGFYEAARIALPADPPQTAGFAVSSDARGVDAAGDGAPDLASADEAAYGRYQTATIQFVDDRTPVAGLAVGAAKADYAVALRAMPLVADLQGFLSGRDVGPIAGDVHVRAAVPCFVRVGLTALVPASAPQPDPSELAAAVAAAVNATGFEGALYASLAADAVRPLLPAGSALGMIELFGRVRRPDGGTTYLTDPRGVVLTVPSDPGRLVTARTVAFFCDPADVIVAVRTPG